MAESDQWEPYRTHDQVCIAIPNVADKKAVTNQPGDTQHTGGTHLEDGGLKEFAGIEFEIQTFFSRGLDLFSIRPTFESKCFSQP